MFENPKPTPSDPSLPSGLTLAERLIEAWNFKVDQPNQNSFDQTIQNAAEVFDRFFGPHSTEAFPDKGIRTGRLTYFISVLARKIAHELEGQRESHPAAATLFQRIDETLRDAIPQLSTFCKSSLLSSGYPLGSGTDSLAALCITSELATRGSWGVLSLFCAYGSTNQRAPWREDILIAANSALKDAHKDGIGAYVEGFKHFFAPSSTWASRAHELLAGLSATIPVGTLVALYDRMRESPSVALEAKMALLSAVVTSIDTLTKGHLRNELFALKTCGMLPMINLRVVKPTMEISRSSKSPTARERASIESLRQLLSTWLAKATRLVRDVPAPPESKPSETLEPATEPGTSLLEDQSPEVSPGKQQEMAERLASALTTLKGQALKSFVSQALNNGLRNKSSKISEQFPTILNDVSIEPLLVIRDTLASSKNVPNIHLQTVEARIHKELTDTVPTLETEKVAVLYGLCRELGSCPHEEREVYKLLRQRFRLPPREEEPSSQPLSESGLKVWQWIFSDTPPNPILLADFVTAHLERVMARAACEIHGVHGSILDSLLPYAKELHILTSYKPGPLFSAVPTWRQIVFTAEAQLVTHNTSPLVSSLVNAICKRLISRGPVWHDDFPTHWRTKLPVVRINAVAEMIRTNLPNYLSRESFEEHTCLANNLHLIGRRGPEPLALMVNFARDEFVRLLRKQDLRDIRAFDNSSLKEVILALGGSGYRSLHVLGVLSEECVSRADSLSPVEFSQIAQAFAELRIGDARFWSAFGSHIETNWDTYNSSAEDGVPPLFRLWSLAVMAPDRMPSRFDHSALEANGATPYKMKIAQTLIALGKYSPQPSDPLFHHLTKPFLPTKMSRQEREFMNLLPTALGVSQSELFSSIVVGGFETDFVIDFGHRRLIIELDGPRHFLRGPQGGMLRGRDEFQDAVFRELGYEVFHYPADIFPGSDEGRSLLKELGDLATSIRAEGLGDKTPRRVYLEDLSSKGSEEETKDSGASLSQSEPNE